MNKLGEWEIAWHCPFKVAGAKEMYRTFFIVGGLLCRRSQLTVWPKMFSFSNENIKLPLFVSMQNYIEKRANRQCVLACVARRIYSSASLLGWHVQSIWNDKKFTCGLPNVLHNCGLAQIYIFLIFFLLMGSFSLSWDFLHYSHWSCITSGSLLEMLESNPRSLPQKSAWCAANEPLHLQLVTANIEKLFLNGNFTCQPVWFGLTSRQIVAFRETNFKDNFKQDGGPK